MGKTKLLINCLRNPTSTCASEKLKNKLREASSDWLLPLTHLTLRCQTQWREGHSTHESGPAGNTLQIVTFYTLILQTLMDELQPQLGYVELWQKQMKAHWTNNDSSSLSLYNIHSAATWRRWHNDTKVWSCQSLAIEYTWRSRSWRWHSAANPHTGEQYSRIKKINV